ncbi:MAG: lipoyl synthase [Actinobacteria bacterium]|nr:lipoyl synthase [Actinomycetota bacterium]
MDKKPVWLRKRIALNNDNISMVRGLIEASSLHSVCQSAKCPNIFECFSKKTATLMLMGDICTRNCRFCGVESGKPLPLDPGEPYNTAAAIRKMGLKYAVITSVTRDDLEDGGAGHFAKTVENIKELNPGIRVECLVPDFRKKTSNLEILLRKKPDVLNHNIETVEKNYKDIRNKADYGFSLGLLKEAKRLKPGIYTKSGFMLGLGEDKTGIIQLLKDLKEADCDIITIGQYLRPSDDNIEVSKYYTPGEFEEIKKIAESMGFKAVVSGAFVRSSYHAREALEEVIKKGI